jgi:hypothetical protein
MNKKSVLVLALLLGAVSALFAQGGEIVRVGEQFFLQTAKGELVPVTLSKVAVEGAVNSALNKAAIKQVGPSGVTGASKAVAGTGLESVQTPAPKNTKAAMPTFRSDFPYMSELQARLEEAVSPILSKIEQNSANYVRIKKSLKNSLDPLDEEAVLKLQQDYFFIKNEWEFLLEQYGAADALEVRLAVGNLLKKGIDMQLAPTYAQLDKFMGTHFQYPQKSTEIRAFADQQFARFPAGLSVSPKMMYLKYLQEQRDFADGIIPAAPQAVGSEYEPIYDFMAAMQYMQEKYGNTLSFTTYWRDKVGYDTLEDAILFRSVGAPSVHATDNFRTLEDYSAGPAIFEVPEYLQREYISSVYERLSEFIDINHRYPYFSADPAAKEYIFDRAALTLSEESRLHLAVRRCLAFPEYPETRSLKDLAKKGKKMVGTKLHDAKLPAVTY